MYILLLTLHLTGAVIMAIAATYSLVSITINKSTLYQRLAYSIGGLGIFQMISGGVLSMLTTTSILVVCSKLFLYLALTVALEIALIRKIAQMRNTAEVTA